ncbi:uncharacterized protein KRP23_7435 [Phytophthora ramorum]|uniref:uncharacterized protein n=1 Tax=Phytophthora ramorum TaxID=164328 RepID=UPI00309C4737|nr:hypothetical protein KRP23_7435 [Phytophthora ramorum]
MSTVHTLLSGLQDRGKRTATSVRHLLLELAACCRCEDAKASILADGLEPLLALAADDQELPRGETLEVLLELLVLLVLDDPKAKADAARGGALEVAVRCLHELSAGAAGGRRRAKILKRALELVDLLSHTTESQQQERQTIVVKQVVEMVIRVDEDGTVLVRATDTLGRFIDGSVERIQVAAKEGAVAVLIELIQLKSEKMELKRTACEVLKMMGEAPGMLQMMAAQNIVSALSKCLRMETPARELEYAVVSLLLRLAREALVYGQIIHDGMVPLLFRVIERNSNVREVTTTACTIIADLTDFALQCKLDLSPFVECCRGKVLVLAATCHAQDANVVDSTFRFFVNVSSNPVDLPLLINAETIEGLLSLLSRSTLEQFAIQEEDITLPALFLCLRNYHDDTRFASQVFNIVAKHWKIQGQLKSARSITGYVGIAVEVLCKNIPSSKSWGDETVEICNFIREMMLSKDGAAVVLNCGGKDLLEVLHTYLPVRDDNSSSGAGSSSCHGESCNSTPMSKSPFLNAFGGEKIAAVVVNMLEKAVLGLTDLATMNTACSSESSANDQQQALLEDVASLRIGDAEYDEYFSCSTPRYAFRVTNRRDSERY